MELLTVRELQHVRELQNARELQHIREFLSLYTTELHAQELHI